MTLEITQQDANSLRKLRADYLCDEKVQRRMWDAFDCFNVWQDNAYLSPEQLQQMTDDMVFYASLAIVTNLFELVI